MKISQYLSMPSLYDLAINERSLLLFNHEKKLNKYKDTLLKRIAASLPEVEDAYIRFNLKAGTCNALYMTTETSIAVTMLPFDADGWSADYYVWDTVNQGVCTEGFVVGTSPELKFG